MISIYFDVLNEGIETNVEQESAEAINLENTTTNGKVRCYY